jgi:alpha-galactosidase
VPIPQKAVSRPRRLLTAFSIAAMSTPEIIAVYQSVAPPLDTNFAHPAWQGVEQLPIHFSWHGEKAPVELHTTARILWTNEYLWLGFECGYTELDVDEQFNLEQKRYALWERDVCEAFIRSPLEPGERSYKEFEVAPTGQWFDVAIRQPRVEVDWDWQSGMRTAGAIEADRQVWRAVMAIPFSAFGVTPQDGDIWYGNLFRVSRWRGERQFLAFSPTLTATPDYHVPERFVALRFQHR